MFRRITLMLVCFALGTYIVQAQEEAKTPEEEDGWEVIFGVGADLAQLLQINPRVGAGENRLGLGTAVSLTANYKKKRLAWDNIASWNFAVQKLGAGPLPTGADNPFQKSIDELKFASKLGYQTSEESKWFYAVDLNFLSQVTPTYIGPDSFPGNYLTDVTDSGLNPSANFFSPAILNFSIGMDFKPTNNFSLFLSPIGYKAIIVADDDIAALGDLDKGVSLHGNEWNSPTDFKNARHHLGAFVKAIYANKYFEDKMAFKTVLNLYSNYLDHPERVDVEWTTETAYNLFKGLQLVLTTNLFYDYDVLVQDTDWDEVGGVALDADGAPVLKRGVNFTQQLLIKYNIVF